MSRHRTYDDLNRVHSALDRSPNDHHISHEDFEDAQTIAASSLMDPWSQYNTRLGPDQISSCAPSRRSPQPHTFNIQNPTEYSTQAFHGNFSPVKPRSAYVSPVTAALFTPFPPTSPPFAAASHHTTNIHTDIDTITCAHCNQDFTGTYRNGNLARHVRQKHVGTNRSLYKCTAQGCAKVFQRQDARLKHERNRHPELRLPPIQRRQGIEHYRATSSGHEVIHAAHDLEHTMDQWLQPDETLASSYAHEAGDKQNSTVRFEQSLHVAQYALTNLESRLPPTDFSSSTDTQPSNGSYAARSSPRHESTLTNPSSDDRPFDPRLLSPYSPSSRRLTSLPPAVTQDGPQLHRFFPSRRSLPDNSEDSIDLALLTPVLGDNDDLALHYSGSRY